MASETNKENLVKIVYDDSKVLKSGIHVEEKLKPPCFPCFICVKVFSRKEALSKHIKTHKGSDGHRCPRCTKTFVAARDLKKHMDIVHLNKADEYKKECPICHVRVQQLKTHIRFIHRKEAKTSEYFGSCPHCNKTFSNDYKVKRHIETVHEGVKHWQCSLCNKSFYEKKDLGRHVRGVHMGEKVDTWRQNKKGDNRHQLGTLSKHDGLSTVDEVRTDLGQTTTLPVNVLAGECDERPEEVQEDEEAEDDPGMTNEVNYDDEVSIDPLHVDEDEEDVNDDTLRFQVCDKRIDDNGDIVVEIIEKEPALVEQRNLEGNNTKMVTLRWGDSAEQENVVPEQKKYDGNNCVMIQKCAEIGKIMDLNPKVEDIMQGDKNELNSSSLSGEDFVLPEVMDELPNWLQEMDLLRVGMEQNDKEEGRTAFRCGACGKMFVSLEFLKTHIEKIHIHSKLEEGGEGLIESKETGPHDISTDLAENIENNIKQGESKTKGVVAETKKTPNKNSKASEEKVVCEAEGCDKTFSGKGRRLQLKRHTERKHLSIRTKQCPRCDLSFYEARDLSRHVEAVHLRIRTVCPVGGGGRPVVRLDQHIKLVHSGKVEGGAVASTCKECGATFSRIYDLARHQENVHRGCKNFGCDKCDRRFSDKRDLKRHYDAVHLNIKQTKVYTCNLCPTSFKLKKHLDTHRMTEHSDQTTTSNLAVNPPRPNQLVISQIPTDENRPAVESLTNHDSSEGVIISINNLCPDQAPPQLCDTDEGRLSVANQGEFSTVDIDGQLFLVQQGPVGISLLPVLQVGQTSSLTVPQS